MSIESLRAIFTACDRLGLDSQDVSDIFCNNALRLIGLQDDSTVDVQQLYRHARTRIPGGTQLLSKRPEQQAPQQWPAYFSEARGCEIRDLEGRRFVDMWTNGIGACLLGCRSGTTAQRFIVSKRCVTH